MYRIIEAANAQDLEDLIKKNSDEWYDPYWSVNVCAYPGSVTDDIYFLYTLILKIREWFWIKKK